MFFRLLRQRQLGTFVHCSRTSDCRRGTAHLAVHDRQAGGRRNRFGNAGKSRRTG